MINTILSILNMNFFIAIDEIVRYSSINFKVHSTIIVGFQSSWELNYFLNHEFQ